MKIPKSIQRVRENFEKLPGIGPKTAQRLAYYLLHVPQPQLEQFGDSLKRLKLETKLCTICMNLGEKDICEICDDDKRNKQVICVVEQPLDMIAIESSGKYDGVYHVLHGVISPLEYIGPDEIYINSLLQRVGLGLEEVVMALNPTMEGEATSLYIKQAILKKLQPTGKKVRISQLAQGLPLGGDLEYADSVTLGKALAGRREY